MRRHPDELAVRRNTDPTPTTLNWRSHMTLIRSILLGSGAAIVAVASAQAADLPTRKAAPVEYVRVCNVGGITGWTLPGSDTCVKFSGYMTAHFIAGNSSNQYNSPGRSRRPSTRRSNPFAASHLSQVLMVQGGDAGGPVPAGRPLDQDQESSTRSRRQSSVRRLRRLLLSAASRQPLSRRVPRSRFPIRGMRFSIAMRSAGTSEPTSALISRPTLLTAR